MGFLSAGFGHCRTGWNHRVLSRAGSLVDGSSQDPGHGHVYSLWGQRAGTSGGTWGVEGVREKGGGCGKTALGNIQFSWGDPFISLLALFCPRNVNLLIEGSFDWLCSV